MADYIAIVVTTLGNEAAANEMSRRLIEQRLSACVQVLPVASIYRWEGEVEQTREWRLEAKTTSALASRLAEAIAADHPNDIPEILTIHCAASAAYAEWVGMECNGARE